MRVPKRSKPSLPAVAPRDVVPVRRWLGAAREQAVELRRRLPFGGGNPLVAVEAGAPYVICENLVKIYKVEDLEVMALQGLDLTVRRGELMAIIGASGSGKSTLLNVLGGLDAPTAGKARVGRWDLIKMRTSDRVRYKRHEVGFVWQNVGRNLIPYLNAIENVEMPMILGGTFDSGRAKKLLEMVGLGKRMHHGLTQLSGGEQQRVAIALALANNPPFILADEPTGSLDSRTGAQVLDVFRTVQEELGVTVVVVTHDMGLARVVDRYVLIRDGKTSTEAVRRRATQAAPEAARAEDVESESHDLEVMQAAETHDEYLLLDSAGRLQIPPEVREALGIRARVRLSVEESRLVIEPGEEEAAG